MITYKDIKGLNKEKFVSALHEAPWDCAFEFEDINDIVDTWYNVFNDIIDEHLPLEQKRVKRNVQPKWFNTEILKKIKARDKLLSKARKSQATRDWDAFKRAKNTVTQLIRSTKQSYFKDKVAENRNNSRKLWNLIKCSSKDDREAESGVKELVENETNISDKQSIAEILNSFFVDQPKKLVAALGPISLNIISTTTTIRQGIGAFDLPRITQKRVVELLLSIPTHKATEDDGISAKILRIAAPATAPSLTKLLNYCLSVQTFPTIWKIAKVTPVFKVPEFRSKVGENEVVAVVEGADAKLPCPVKSPDTDSRYGLNVYWEKGNVTLEPAEHSRMRIKPTKYLKIKRTQKEDAGHYTCIAQNSCGGKNAFDVQLFVESPTRDPNRNTMPAAPKFTVSLARRIRNRITVPVGNSVKLDCSAEGYSRPTVVWYKDGALFQERKHGSSIYLNKRSMVVVMRDVVPSDSGIYTCNVSNRHGRINHSYSVVVHERVRARPVVLEMKNVTVCQGQNATLLCKALSDSMPHFQWLRWFSSSSNRSANGSQIAHPNHTYEIIKQNEQSVIQYLVVPTKQSKFEFHGKKLTFINVTKNNEGKYTCIVGNAVGYAVEQAYIFVRDRLGPTDACWEREEGSDLPEQNVTGSTPSEEPQNETPGNDPEDHQNKQSWISRIRYPGAVIAVLVTVFIVLISLPAWYCWQKKKSRTSRRSHLDSIYPRYEVTNEYVVVPDFKRG